LSNASRIWGIPIQRDRIRAVEHTFELAKFSELARQILGWYPPVRRREARFISVTLKPYSGKPIVDVGPAIPTPEISTNWLVAWIRSPKVCSAVLDFSLIHVLPRSSSAGHDDQKLVNLL
jgi:hypothetical protein